MGLLQFDLDLQSQRRGCIQNKQEIHEIHSSNREGLTAAACLVRGLEEMAWTCCSWGTEVLCEQVCWNHAASEVTFFTLIDVTLLSCFVQKWAQCVLVAEASLRLTGFQALTMWHYRTFLPAASWLLCLGLHHYQQHTLPSSAHMCVGASLLPDFYKCSCLYRGFMSNGIFKKENTLVGVWTHGIWGRHIKKNQSQTIQRKQGLHNDKIYTWMHFRECMVQHLSEQPNDSSAAVPKAKVACSECLDQRRSSRNSAPNTASSKMDLQSNNPQYKQRMYCRRQILKQSTNKTISLTHCVFNSATKASTASRLRKFVVLYSWVVVLLTSN